LGYLYMMHKSCLCTITCAGFYDEIDGLIIIKKLCLFYIKINKKDRKHKNYLNIFGVFLFLSFVEFCQVLDNFILYLWINAQLFSHLQSFYWILKVFIRILLRGWASVDLPFLKLGLTFINSILWFFIRTKWFHFRYNIYLDFHLNLLS
jgi:hypothetical protein